ncbi:TFIID subunit 6 [Seminavis robusta]|uniref:TFIID subunit 6 n=1 Tax=Seminavis robusta TaxID=568900 RepID=A0A9N8HQ80_9STRA|nr:TFIID subunit 6 [Seminavis robusta]|eukprot:Sro1168_g248460.1 TFIID subunit 6 (449) ;mRNA; f:7394-9088
MSTQAASNSGGGSSANNNANNSRSTLVKLVEEHLTNLIRDANVIKRHCKRARLHLTSKDDPRGVVRRRLHAEDINLALQWRGSEKLYATGTVIPNDDHKTSAVDLEEYLKSEMQLRPPLEVGLTTHWLAVDGVMPDIPQNPSLRDQHHRKRRAIVEAGEGDVATALDSAANSNNNNGVKVSQLLPLLLSEELQLYFTRITLAIQRGGATPTTRQQQDSALASVARDAGLQELVPFFTKYISQELSSHVGNPDHCRTLVRLALSMLQNPHLHLELHLHQLLPSLMTCVVASKLSSRPTDDHWALRREAAQTLIRACNLFGEEYATLKARVLRTLCDGTGPDKTVTTQYGGIVAISLFGSKAIDAFLLPVVPAYYQEWEKELAKVTDDMERRTELVMCQQAVLNALGIFLRRVDMVEQSSRVSWDELEETFGDLLVPSASSGNEYTTCFI